MLARTLFFVALITVPSGVNAQNQATASMKSMEWLLGTWSRTNSKPGRSGWEEWTKKSATEWVGRGVSMKGLDTAFVEKIRIIIENDKLYYVADVPENKKLVYFEIVSVTKDGFVCQNPQHDFPKRIVYQLNGSILNARVSGDDKSIEYLFVRN